MAIYVWLVLVALFFILELCTGEFILCWFAIGAVVAEIFALFSLPVWAQAIVFVAVSLVLILSLRRVTLNAVIKNKDKRLKKYALNKIGIVKKEVASRLLYLASFGKKNFVVMLQTPAPLKEGDAVKVISVTGGVAMALPEKEAEIISNEFLEDDDEK